ncbi:hypothetical protein GCM10020220_108090 [Nonomuraea rubra]
MGSPGLSLSVTFWNWESGGGAATPAWAAAAGIRSVAAVRAAITVLALMPLSFGLLGGIREGKLT